MTQRGPRRQGFTLIELLVVIAIIVILAAVLFPVFERAQSRGRQAACLSNLKQLGEAAIMYAQDNKGRLPAHQPAFYWALLPFGKSPKVFLCPADEYARRCKDPDFGDFISSYGMNGNLLTAAGAGVVTDTLPDPPAIPLFADVTKDGSSWLFSDGDTGTIHRRHAEGANFVFCDGHARLIKGAAIDGLAYNPNVP